jgi:hypothetical protein
VERDVPYAILRARSKVRACRDDQMVSLLGRLGRQTEYGPGMRTPFSAGDQLRCVVGAIARVGGTREKEAQCKEMQRRCPHGPSVRHERAMPLTGTGPAPHGQERGTARPGRPR